MKGSKYVLVVTLRITSTDKGFTTGSVVSNSDIGSDIGQSYHQTRILLMLSCWQDKVFHIYSYLGHMYADGEMYP